MNLQCRLITTLLFAVVITICTFGFLATFEPLPVSVQAAWRAIYGAVAFAGTAVLAWLWRPRHK